METLGIKLKNEPSSELGMTVSIEITDLDLANVQELARLPEMVMSQYRHANRLCGVPDEITEKVLSSLRCGDQ